MCSPFLFEQRSMKLSMSPYVAPLLFCGALVSAVFFQGSYADFLCLTLALLACWGARIAWVRYQERIDIPKTPVAAFVTLYWAWLAVSANWGAVSYVGTLGFWWLAPLPLVFWLYVLSPKREQETLWHCAFIGAVAMGIVLALYAAIQDVMYGLDPRATFLNRQSFAALLNLIAIPLCGYFLIASAKRTRLRIFIGIAIFVLISTLALISGRGATYSAAVGMAILAVVAWQHAVKRHVLVLLGLVAVAFLVGSQIGSIGTGERLASVITNPWEAGSARFIIWKQSWEMLKDAPWMGVGIAHYALYYPSYRAPGDQNAGFFVHNDYLQIWIETGLPGLLLLIAVLGAVSGLYIRAIRHRTFKGPKAIELTALFAGLLAVAMHSFVDFNLYVLSVMALAGLTLGRFHALASSGRSAVSVSFSPAKSMTRGGYRLLVAILTALPIFYFATLGVGSFEYRRGLDLAWTGDFDAADAAFARSARFYPFADNAFMSRADLLRHIISVAPPSAAIERRALFNEAEGLLARAERLNPLRAQTFAVHAAFYEQNKDFVGAGWHDQVARYYEHALALDPRLYQARELYARFLLREGRRMQAMQLMEEGVKFYYWPAESLVTFYGLAAGLRSEAGDKKGASLLLGQALELRRQAQDMRSPVLPERDIVKSP
jgi:O-antigen ligase